MDPITVAVLAGASGSAGAAATLLMDRTAAQSTTWLRSRFGNHEDVVQARARENALVFLADLAHRVELLEGAEDGKEIAAEIDRSLDDPEVSAVMEDAVLAAARVSDHERQTLLARIIAERLHTEPTDVSALAASLAVDAVPKLAPDHLKVLGLIALVLSIRPDPLQMPEAGSGEEVQFWREFAEKRVGLFAPIPDLSEVHFRHMAAIGCVENSTDWKGIRYDFVPHNDFEWSNDINFWATDLGRDLESRWNGPLGHATPTSTGQLIGIYVHDSRLGGQTNLRW